MAFLPINPKDWICPAGHRRVLFAHPVTEMRLLRCPDCDEQEIHKWLSGPGGADETTQAQCAGGPERTMTIQQLLVAITDAVTSMTPEEKAEFRKALDGEQAEQDDEWMAHHWHNRRNPDVLSLNDSDYKFLREMKVKP